MQTTYYRIAKNYLLLIRFILIIASVFITRQTVLNFSQ